MNTTLIFGILLIVAGVAFAILAYALILSRREEPAEAKEEEPAEAAEGLAAAAQDAEPELRQPAPADATPSPTVPSSEAEASLPKVPAAPPPPPTVPAPERGTIPIAVLLRDELTGSLIVDVGARRYRDPDELRASGDLPRMEAAARDLQRWLAGAPATRPAEEPRRDETAAKSGSMLDQINRILERKLAVRPEMPQGVRLVPSAEGGVRVMIGLQSYPLDEVPDTEINRLIRESVTEWENQD